MASELTARPEWGHEQMRFESALRDRGLSPRTTHAPRRDFIRVRRRRISVDRGGIGRRQIRAGRAHASDLRTAAFCFVFYHVPGVVDATELSINVGPLHRVRTKTRPHASKSPLVPVGNRGMTALSQERRFQR